tara:strand:+ start:117 stop:347 length:231 start_codon:yes stop_codon:yes gene_type:complete
MQDTSHLRPIVDTIIEELDSGRIKPYEMLNAILFLAVYIGLKCRMSRQKLMSMLAVRWIELELADGQADWAPQGEA